MASVLSTLQIGKRIAFFFIKALRSLARTVEELTGLEGFYLFHLHGKINHVDMRSEGNRHVVDNGGTRSLLRAGTSDESVYVQVFYWEDYNRVVAFIKENHIPIKTMIDAGANIGLTTQLFCKSFPGIEVVAVEPDMDNYRMLKENVALVSQAKVYCLQAGISPASGWLIPEEKIRKGEEWSRVFTFNEIQGTENAVPAYTIEAIMQENGWEFVDFLKMDIEGAEHPIFQSIGQQGSFLDRIGIIAIEIHGNSEERAKVTETLRRHSFMLVQSREITIGIKRSIL